jgi:hypothetical protein
MIVATDPNTQERLLIKLTPPPSAGFVAGVQRQMYFPPGSQPALTTLVDNLRKKYGPETVGPDVVFSAAPGAPGIRLYDNGASQTFGWLFDKQGQLIKWSDEKARQLQLCSFGQSAYVDMVEGDLGLPQMYQFNSREQGPPPININVCGGARVDVQLAPMASGVVQNMTVNMGFGLLYQSANASTWRWLDQMALEAIEKERQQGQQVAAPKL